MTRLRAVPSSAEQVVERPRVCEIRRIPNEAHMLRCVQAIRDREPPLWSWSGFRVTERPKLRGVR